MNKELQFNKDARTSMLKGMEILANAVGSTLGPKGKCVVIDEAIDGRPLVTKDGRAFGFPPRAERRAALAADAREQEVARR